MTFHVKTTVFEGPFDLLLQLITKHQVEVTAVGITGVVEEYLAFLEEMKQLDLEVTSEFLLIAATLVQLKSSSLLPSGSEMDLDDELALIEERDRLLSRLLVCVTFKDVAAVLTRRLQEAARFVPRISGLDQAVKATPPPTDFRFDPSMLAARAGEALVRRRAEPDLDHLDLDLPSVENAIIDLRERVAMETSATFAGLTEHCSSSMEVAAYFLALLELARWGLVTVSQSDWLSDIDVSHIGDAEMDLTSEWAS